MELIDMFNQTHTIYSFFRTVPLGQICPKNPWNIMEWFLGSLAFDNPTSASNLLGQYRHGACVFWGRRSLGLISIFVQWP